MARFSAHRGSSSRVGSKSERAPRGNSTAALPTKPPTHTVCRFSEESLTTASGRDLCPCAVLEVKGGKPHRPSGPGAHRCHHGSRWRPRPRMFLRKWGALYRKCDSTLHRERFSSATPLGVAPPLYVLPRRLCPRRMPKLWAGDSRTNGRRARTRELPGLSTRRQPGGPPPFFSGSPGECPPGRAGHGLPRECAPNLPSRVNPRAGSPGDRRADDRG